MKGLTQYLNTHHQVLRVLQQLMPAFVSNVLVPNWPGWHVYCEQPREVTRMQALAVAVDHHSVAFPELGVEEGSPMLKMEL